jgi:hypothetical protein
MSSSENENGITDSSSNLKLSEYAEKALHKVAANEGFEKYKFQIEEGSSFGDGFSGILLKVEIIENDNSKQLNVVVKSPPDNVQRRETFGTMKLFEREVFVYAELLPIFVKFQTEKKVPESIGFFNFPKCYLAEYDRESDDAIIILEDLRDSGYKMVDKHIPINYEHAKLSFSALGRLHAISFALREKKPEIFEIIRKLEDNTKGNLDNEMIANFLEGSLDRAIGTLREDDVHRKEKLLKLKSEMIQLMRELANSEGAEPYAVVGHGDCWSNNFMFKYRVIFVFLYNKNV